MKNREFKFRVWDPIRKELAPVWELILDTIQIANHTAVKANFKDGVACANPNFVVTQSTGVQDDNKKEVFEEDLLDCIFLHPKTNYMTPMRARVIWNPYIHMGPVGFILMDQDGGMHPFNIIDSFVVVGNTFQGVIK